jgi:LEA14-like dessication related protein
MGLIKKLVGLAFLVLLLWGGYVVYAALTANPQFSARWGTVNESVTNIVITGEWKKPLLVPIDVNKLAVNFTGVEVVRVSKFNYSPTGTSAVAVVSIDNHNLIRALVNYLNNGQRGTAVITFNGKFLKVIPIDFNLKEEVNEDLLSQLNFTAESKDLLGGLAKTPALVSTKVEWKGERGNTGILVAYMKFYNPNDFPIPIGNISFDFYANGVKIGEGQTSKTVIIPAKGYATLPVETTIDEAVLPKVWAMHVRNGEQSTLLINLYLTVTLNGRDFTVKLLSQKETVKTDIMGQLNKTLEELSKELSRG